MANCLVTKLKAEVNNPDLPVLESMQQFTLDAITASGNASMTDAQKLALNHFFYRIGAIDNNGIYAKLHGLYMPLLCADLAHALVDYKGSNTKDISSKNVKLQSHGIVKNDTSGSNSNIVLAADNAGANNSLTVAAMFTEGFSASGSLAILGFRAQSADTPIQITAARSSTKDYIALLAQRATIASTAAFNGFVGTIDGNNHSALFIAENDFASTGTESSGSTAPSALSYVTCYWNNTNPIGIYLYGSALTSDESARLASAMKELVAAFVS